MSRQPIIMAEEYWANSHFSVVRYTGGCTFNGKEYVIINKDGNTIYELSDPTSRHYVGDDNMAIEPGQPADLIQKAWIPVFKKLGRAKFLELISTKDITLAQALKMKRECMQLV